VLTDPDPLQKPDSPDGVDWRVFGAIVAGILLGAAMAIFRWSIPGL
jgi:hypothetical protein